MNPLLQCKLTILPLFIAGVLACFELLPQAQAAPEGPAAPQAPQARQQAPAGPEIPPGAPTAPQVALPGFNTADGASALASVTTGAANSAFGWSITPLL